MINNVWLQREHSRKTACCTQFHLNEKHVFGLIRAMARILKFICLKTQRAFVRACQQRLSGLLLDLNQIYTVNG